MPGRGVGGAPEPFWRSDLDQYTDLADALSGAEYSENFAGAGFVSLTLESGAGQSWGDKYFRQLADGSGLVTGSMTITPPGFANTYREIWWEFWFRFDNAWAGTSDHKWMLWEDPSSVRWSVKPGHSGKTRLRLGGDEDLLDTDGRFLETHFWTGQWQRLRGHMKMSTDDVTADGIFRVYVNGTWIDTTTNPYNNLDGTGLITDAASAFFGQVTWGGTVDPQAGGNVGTEWGEIAVWTSDPGGESWLTEAP